MSKRKKDCGLTRGKGSAVSRILGRIGKVIFCKIEVPRNVQMIGFEIVIFVALVGINVVRKKIGGGAKIKFVAIIGM